MNRLATNLAVVSLNDRREISHWNVEFRRELAFDPQLLPPDTSSEPLLPIVEWVARQGINAPGQVVITLQGFANPLHRAYQHWGDDADDHPDQRSLPLRRHRPVAITLIFDACFRNKG